MHVDPISRRRATPLCAGIARRVLRTDDNVRLDIQIRSSIVKNLSALVATLIFVIPQASSSADTPQPPKELLKVLRYYTGNWSVTGSLGDAAIKGKASFRMPAGKHCIVGTVSFEAQGQPMHISLVSGWDSSTEWYTEQGLVSDGTVYAMKWRRVSLISLWLPRKCIYRIVQLKCGNITSLVKRYL